MRLTLAIALLLVALTPAVASAEPQGDCLVKCPSAGAQRNGNTDVQVNAGRTTPGTTIVRPVGGGHSTAADTATGRSRRSDCPGCTYTRVPLVGPGAPGGRTGIPFLGCAGAQFGQTQLVYRTTPGQLGRDLVGIACPGTPNASPDDPEPVITLEMIEGEVQRFAEQVAPPSPELGFAPSAAGIVNLPLLVWATPQQTIRRDFAPFGVPVSVTLTPSWQWTFEPGVTTRTVTPGQPYRDNGVPVARDPAYVTHTYTTPGAKQVTVTVRWAATWSLDGGPSRALGDLTRADTAGVSIREAPSRLVAR